MGRDVNIYCDESTHLPNDGQPFMGLGAVSCSPEISAQAAKRIREIRLRHGLPEIFEIKWSKVSPAKINFYRDVIDYFFDDDDLSFRVVIAQKDGLVHQTFGQDHDEWYYKMIFYLVRNLLSTTGKNYIYLDRKDTQGGVKVRKLHEVIANSEYDFSRNRIKRVQIVESHHVGLIQLADLLLGAVNYSNRQLEGSGAKMNLVRRIEERSGYELTRSTLPSESKFNIFKWVPRKVGE